MHIYRKHILEQYLDTYGHVNHATYLTILEEARWEWITERGCGLNYIHQTQMGPIILEVNIRYMRELRLREWITIESHLVKWEGKIGLIEQRMVKEDGQIATKASLKFGLLDFRSRKLCEPTSTWLQAFQV